MKRRRTLTFSPKGPQGKFQGFAAYQDRRSIWGITRPFGGCYPTAVPWLGERMAGTPGLLLPQVPGEPPRRHPPLRCRP